MPLETPKMTNFADAPKRAKFAYTYLHHDGGNFVFT